MPDERANRDDNSITTLIGETVKGEIRRVRTSEIGLLLTDIGATIYKLIMSIYIGLLGIKSTNLI